MRADMPHNEEFWTPPSLRRTQLARGAHGPKSCKKIGVFLTSNASEGREEDILAE